MVDQAKIVKAMGIAVYLALAGYFLSRYEKALKMNIWINTHYMCRVIHSAIKLSERAVGLSEVVNMPDKVLYPSVTVCFRAAEFKNQLMQAIYIGPGGKR